MAKVTIRRNEEEFTVEDISFEQVKELIGVNGYHRESSAGPTMIAPRPINSPDFAGFMKSISDRGRDFLRMLKEHPQGIEANSLAGNLGFKDARQIGGLTGGGLSKAAKTHGVELKDVYRPEITFPGGKRTVTFYPGKLLNSDDMKKPAV